MMWRLLAEPGYKRAVMSGVVAGVAHLTKASILPGLTLFLLFMVGRCLGGIRSRPRASGGAPSRLTAHSIGAALVVACAFLLTVYPYISTSKRVFGQYSYNVNSTFYFWYDSWEQVERGTRAHGDREGWPRMPPEDIPSPSKYLREHTPAQMVERTCQGAASLVKSMAGSYGYFKYLMMYAGVLAGAAVWRRHAARRLIAANVARLLFVSAYLMAYFLLYAWFTRLTDGNRLILAQYLPLIYLLVKGTQELLRGETFRMRERAVPALTAIHVPIFAVLAVDIVVILMSRVMWMVGGL